IVIEGEKGDFEYTMPININFNYVTCHECLKKKGSYYEGILQIRGEKEKQEQFANMIIKMLKRHTFISKIEEIKEGINIYVGSSKALLNLITNIGIKNYKLSRKLHTAKQGKRVYRLTIAVRLE
ncbi:MAG: NMD3-related protein, partial [Candidatus Anstonellales archaeon]